MHHILSRLVSQWSQRLGPRLHVVSEFSLADRLAALDGALGVSVR